MKQAQVQYRINWERIFGKKAPLGYLYPLPQEAATAIIQYSPDFKISCLIPPKKRNIVVEYRSPSSSDVREFKREISTPTLLLSHLIRRKQDSDIELSGFYADDKQDAINHHPACHCEYCKSPLIQRYRIKNQYYLFAVDDRKADSIWAQPYRLCNVYEDGRCCFKKDRSRVALPSNLKQAHVAFWMDRFDNDFNPGPIPHTCTSRYHSYRRCKNRRWNHYCYDYGHHEHHCVEHNIDCECCERTCGCENKCKCCNDNCDCAKKYGTQNCDCDCCKLLCDCPCTCYLGEAFANMMMKYAPPDYVAPIGSYTGWLNHTKFVCGSKYLSIPSRVDGVFFSAEPQLLDDIPKQFHRSDRSNQTFIVGFAKECHQGLSIDLRGDFSFNLGLNQYITVQ